MDNLEPLDTALDQAIDLLKASDFYKQLSAGENARAIYATYLKYAYHYVRLSSSFTPLAARRMDEKHIATRKWILEHSSEELGHELMALRDLEILGFDKESVQNMPVPTGVIAWVSFFHYKVAIDNPFCAFGVLYFLEGMAKKLAPGLLPGIVDSLNDDEKRAIAFFREHGDLDEDHVAEQQEILRRTKTTPEEEAAMVKTITEAGQIKRFMLDQLMQEVAG